MPRSKGEVHEQSSIGEGESREGSASRGDPADVKTDQRGNDISVNALDGKGTSPEGAAAEEASRTNDTDDKGVKPAKKAKGRRIPKDGNHPEIKKLKQKDLLDLLQKKNEKLQLMEKEIEKYLQHIENKDDRIIRMVAEFENYKKRTRREWELHQKQAAAELIKDLLGVIDDFERAFEAGEGAEDNFYQGIKLIYGGLLDVLKRVGVEEVKSQGETFDPQFHEAIGEIESDEVEEGRVAQVIQKGYLLNGQLLRPARVVISKGPNG